MTNTRTNNIAVNQASENAINSAMSHMDNDATKLDIYDKYLILEALKDGTEAMKNIINRMKVLRTEHDYISGKKEITEDEEVRLTEIYIEYISLDNELDKVQASTEVVATKLAKALNLEDMLADVVH